MLSSMWFVKVLLYSVSVLVEVEDVMLFFWKSGDELVVFSCL